MTEEAKAQLYVEYSDKVLRYIRGKVNNEHLAEDLCSDVFLKVYENLDRFDETKSSLSTWIFTITRNTLVDYYRTRRVFEEVPETLEDGSSVEDDVCREEMLELLADAMEKLEERERDLIILRYYKGLNLRQIAERMDVSYAYVKIIQNKALGKLREFLPED